MNGTFAYSSDETSPDKAGILFEDGPERQRRHILKKIKAKAGIASNKNVTKIILFMTNTEQIKGIVERLGALRRYL
ncbi:RidA family protein [Flavobacterium humi]|uniref:RidA family protein n=1 Tax=Flavobacterium humi TaxID=2562683 RepID=UPI00146B007F|nr:RidA family protein [Flavobacterium humi]